MSGAEGDVEVADAAGPPRGAGCDGQSNEKAPLSESSRASRVMCIIVLSAMLGYASYSSSRTVLPDVGRVSEANVKMAMKRVGEGQGRRGR